MKRTLITLVAIGMLTGAALAAPPNPNDAVPVVISLGGQVGIYVSTSSWWRTIRRIFSGPVAPYGTTTRGPGTSEG